MRHVQINNFEYFVSVIAGNLYAQQVVNCESDIVLELHFSVKLLLCSHMKCDKILPMRATIKFKFICSLCTANELKNFKHAIPYALATLLQVNNSKFIDLQLSE